MEPNYYTLLGLKVDTFVSDPAELERRLEAVRLEWNKSNNTDIRAYVTTYYTSGVIKEAFSDPARWKSIYEQAKAQTDDAIINYLMLSKGKGYLYEKEIDNCAKNKDVAASREYVRRIAQAQGIEIRDNAGGSSQAQGKKPAAKLSDYEPASKYAFTAAIKSCSSLLCQDFYDFLRKYSKQSGTATQVCFTADTSPDVCAKAAEEIIAAWSHKKETSERTAVENVCTIIKKFNVPGDKCSQENYNKQLRYSSIKEILDKVWTPMSNLAEQDRIMSGEAQMKLVSELEKVIDDRAKAESVLESFCREKKITTAITQMADRAYCPFCSSLFPKQNGRLPDSCPVCHQSFIMKCPKCAQKVNYAGERKCSDCGFDLGIYPKVSKLCSDARGFIDTLNFDYAETLLADAEKRWKGFPEAREARELLSQKKSIVGKMVSSLEKFISAREYYSAKAEYERICKAIPGYSDSAVEMKINTAVDEADKLYKKARSENDPKEKLRLLIAIKQLTADYPGVDNDLSSIPPMYISKLEVKPDAHSCCIDLTWVSANPDGTVEYELRRKAFTPPVSPSDGELVVKTTEKGFCDNGVRGGEAYYYSIVAVRGRARSRVSVMPDPVVIYPTIIGEPEINCDETSIEASWNADVGKMSVEVYRSENPFIKKQEDGVRVRDCGQNGFVDTGLVLGKKYYYNIFFKIVLKDKAYYSAPVTISGETSRKGRPVKIGIRANDGVKGRFEAFIEDGHEFAPQLQLYASSTNSCVSGTAVKLQQLVSGFGMKRINAVDSGSGTYTFELREGESCYVYPVTVTGSNAVLGAPVYAENFRQVGVKPLRTDGMNLHIELEEWIKGQEIIYVCWRFDRFPTEINEKGTTKIAVNKRNYESGGIVIPNVEQRDYFIAGFVRSGGEEHAVFRTEFRNRRKVEIFYSFSYTGLLSKQLKVTMTMSEPSPLPELVLRTMLGAVPVFESSGSELCVIPADAEEKREHVFTLHGKLNKNLHGKLFLANAEDKNSFQLLLKSGEKTLITD